MMANYSDLIQAAGQQYNVDPKLIGALIQTESSGNPNAVGPPTKYGTATGLTQMLPQTAKALGVNDPTDPKQAIFGAAKLLNENLTRYGNADQAIMAYHGGTDQANWGPKTQDYLQKVTANYQKQQAPAAQQTMPGIPVPSATPASGDDPFSAAFGGEKANAAAAQNSPAAQPQGGDAFSAAFAPPTNKQATPATQPQAPAATPGLGAEIVRQLGLTARMVGHGIGDAVGMIGNPLNIAINAATGSNLQSPGAIINNLVDKITPTPEGGVQNAVQSIGSAVANPLNAIGGGYMAAAKGIAQTAARGALVGGINGAMQQPTDGSVPTVGSMLQQGALGAAGGAVLAPVIGGAGKLLGAASDAIGSGVNRLKALVSPAEAAPATNALTAAAGDATQAAQAGIKPRVKLNTDGTTTPVIPAAASTPAAAVPQFTAPTSPAAKTSLPVPDQQARIDVMKQIGLDNQRPSAITGDKFTAGTDYQQSKLDTPAGQVIRNQLAQEQGAIKNYADSIVQKTGASATSPEQAGQAIRAPMQALSDHYDAQIGQLYKAADQAAAGAPIVQPTTFGKLLDTNSTFAGKAENTALRRGINAYAKEQGMIGADGTLQPMTVESAEGMRQYLNSQWSPQNSGLIGQIKQSLDTDVAKVGGADVYQAARALHAERKNTLDNPNGISALLSESGPGGINKKISDEAVPQKLLNMPTQQFQHIVDTINGLPQELQPQGQQALSEIKGALAQQIYKAGDSGGTQNGPSVWNAANVTKALNTNRSKLSAIFSPEEIQSFQTLNDAGHILQAPSAYPGAAVQGHNLMQRGMILAPSAAGAAAGHMLGGLPGAAVGSMAGNALSRKAASAADQALANKLQGILQSPQVQAPNVIPINRANNLLRLTTPAAAAGTKEATN